MAGGRPGKFENWITEDGLTAIEGWAREGATDEDIAKKIGVSTGTLYDWKKRFPKISEALKKGKAPVDFKVENALLKRALGYDFQEERIEKSDKDGVKIIQTIKHVPGDTTAQIFWLKNRRPDRWRDKHEVTASQTGQLADLIDGLKELCNDDLYAEAAGLDGAVENEPPEED